MARNEVGGEVVSMEGATQSLLPPAIGQPRCSHPGVHIADRTVQMEHMVFFKFDCSSLCLATAKTRLPKGMRCTTSLVRRDAKRQTNAQLRPRFECMQCHPSYHVLPGQQRHSLFARDGRSQALAATAPRLHPPATRTGSRSSAMKCSVGPRSSIARMSTWKRTRSSPNRSLLSCHLSGAVAAARRDRSSLLATA